MIIRIESRKFRGYLRRTAREMGRLKSIAPKEVGQLTQNFAKSVSPVYTGATRNNIVLFNFPKRGMSVVQALPAPSDRGFSTAVPFETGNFGRMTVRQKKGTPGLFIDKAGYPRVPFKPFVRRPISIGFMSRAANFAEQEFPRRISKMVDVII